MDSTPTIERMHRPRFLALVIHQNYNVTLLTDWVTP